MADGNGSDNYPLDRNPRDPLRGMTTTKDRELFLALGQVCTGCSAEEVASATLNLYVNVLRQCYATRSGAESRFVEQTGKARQILLDHYDSVTGKRLSIFPHTQHVHAAHVIDKEKHRGK